MQEEIVKNLKLVLACLLCFFVAPAWAQQHAVQTDVELTGAVVMEQNVTFAVVIVKRSFVNDKNAADSFIEELKAPFGGIPVVLMSQDEKGTPSYYGRKDIAQFLVTVPLENIPWKKYTLSYEKQ